jgi:hypothetical protein
MNPHQEAQLMLMIVPDCGVHSAHCSRQGTPCRMDAEGASIATRARQGWHRRGCSPPGSVFLCCETLPV